ncbi:MAG: DUF1367 family protein [Syntrophales bacterium]|nr:DUF1367 family protein [Syntrophales bacterium]
MQVYLTKTQTGLIPADKETEAWYNKIKSGEVVSSDFKKTRNYQFLKKWFALLNVGFDNWNPGEVNSNYGIPEKNFERFREDVTILAGYFHTVVRLDSSVRIEAKSVAFSNMTEEEFSALYNKTINVLLKRVYNSTLTKEELENIVNQYMAFA